MSTALTLEFVLSLTKNSYKGLQSPTLGETLVSRSALTSREISAVVGAVLQGKGTGGNVHKLSFSLPLTKVVNF